jgi:hypothetical protein
MPSANLPHKPPLRLAGCAWFTEISLATGSTRDRQFPEPCPFVIAMESCGRDADARKDRNIIVRK